MSNNKTLVQPCLFLFLILGMIGCKDQLVFKKIELKKNIIIDTVEQYSNGSVLLGSVNVFYGPFGDFTTYCGFIRNIGSESVIYCADDLIPFRTSREYVAQINSYYFGKTNWGWYNIDVNGEIKPLPNQDKILDSIKAIYGVSDNNFFQAKDSAGLEDTSVEMMIVENKNTDSMSANPSSDYFVTGNDNGFFWIIKNGKTIHEYNYGNIVLRDSSINFDAFDYRLYKIVNNKLVIISDNPDELYKKGEGLYYVPKPGIGVIRKYKIADIDSVLMSYQSSADCPNTIRINKSK